MRQRFNSMKGENCIAYSRILPKNCFGNCAKKDWGGNGAVAPDLLFGCMLARGKGKNGGKPIFAQHGLSSEEGSRIGRFRAVPQARIGGGGRRGKGEGEVNENGRPDGGREGRRRRHAVN